MNNNGLLLVVARSQIAICSRIAIILRHKASIFPFIDSRWPRWLIDRGWREERATAKPGVSTLRRLANSSSSSSSPMRITSNLGVYETRYSTVELTTTLNSGGRDQQGWPFKSQCHLQILNSYKCGRLMFFAFPWYIPKIRTRYLKFKRSKIKKRSMRFI